jgi:hypothetical protein
VSRKNPHQPGEPHEGDGHFGRLIRVFRLFESVDYARREGQRNVGAKTDDFLVRAGFSTDRLTFRVQALQHPYRFEKVISKAFVEEDLG